MEKYPLPTGYLIVDDYSKGKLETLSIGDYGKRNNIKADFLGFTNEINGVANQPCMPLSEKWVITLSTQFGCPMHCTFCDVPKLKFRGDATVLDLRVQLSRAINCYPDVRYTDRLNIHFARMGEPMFNFDNILEFTKKVIVRKEEFQELYNLRAEVIHPVFTTSMPRVRDAKVNLLTWTMVKNDLLNGQAGLQLSINSTSDSQRDQMFGGMAMSLREISDICKDLPNPLSRKYCLNFAYASGYEVDGSKLAELFDPKKFMCKITPIHNNDSCRENGIETVDGYSNYHSYRKPEDSLKAAGFDVLVFIPSSDEENGLVTCGNAVLSGSKVKTVGGPVFS